LANPDTIRKLGAKIGSHVVVVKRGEIIPKIEQVLAEESGEQTSAIVFPTVCGTCGSTLVDDGTRLYCPNKNCSKRILHQLLKWVSVIDIRDLGETLITSLFKNGRVRSISDLYTLTPEELKSYFLNEENADKKDSLGAQKVYDSIQMHRNVSLAAFIAGFDIEGIGETMVQKLVDAGLNTLELLLTAPAEKFAAVYGFADITARVLVSGLQENADEMRALSANTIRLQEGGATGALAGKSFCFTGELRTMKRADAEAMVKKAGGSCKSSVTKDLSYLVTNDTSSGSSKNQKAAKFGIPIINEDEFLALVK
ncbi:MAG: DNA ligase (NAD(+)) LigA, partial [Treponema sp.]|nr:DNA ligase (NAD(+)) LigA [Treponema sp.]